MYRLMAGTALLGALLLGGCAATPRVDVAQDPEADFARYTTFTFHTPLGTDRDSGTRTVLSQQLQGLTRAELEARGYRYVTADADLELDFFVETRERIESVPDSRYDMHYGYWRYPWSVWGGYPPERIRQYTIGTLHVDVVDVARRQLVWEAIAEGRVRGDFSYEQDDVRKAVAEMFERFPRRAGVAPVPAAATPAD